MVNLMTNKKVKKQPKLKNKQAVALDPMNQPWMSMRTGVIVITITSIGMAVLTAIQAAPVKGVFGGILYGLLFGGLIWAIFWGFYFIRRFLGGRG